MRKNHLYFDEKFEIILWSKVAGVGSGCPVTFRFDMAHVAFYRQSPGTIVEDDFRGEDQMTRGRQSSYEATECSRNMRSFTEPSVPAEQGEG